MLAFRLARSGDFLHFIFVVCILHLLQHLNAFTLCLLQIKILWWISIFSKYHLKCHPEGKTCRDQTPPSPQLWMSVNQNWACIVQKSFLKRSIEKLKLFSRSCDVWENWKHSRVYLGLVPDGCNSLQFPPLFNTVSPPTFTAHVPFWPPSSPPTVFCESFIFSGDQPRLLSKLMPTCKNTEALLNAWLNLSDPNMAFRKINLSIQNNFLRSKEHYPTTNVFSSSSWFHFKDWKEEKWKLRKFWSCYLSYFPSTSQG